MPSWNNSETSSEGRLSSGSSHGVYLPDKIEDPTFEGLAIDSTELCLGHKEMPERFVAFEGRNTGRRFLACARKNELENCGFLCWIDHEWPDSLQYALTHLWTKMDECNKARIEEKIDHAFLIRTMSDEKDKAEKKYTGLLAEVGKLLDDTEARVRKENNFKFMNDEDSQKLALSEFARMEIEEQMGRIVEDRDTLYKNLETIENENKSLKEELKLLKHDSEMLQVVQKKREEEMEEMKQEKKKLEYALYDVLKANNQNKDKLKRVRLICDE